MTSPRLPQLFPIPKLPVGAFGADRLVTRPSQLVSRPVRDWIRGHDEDDLPSPPLNPLTVAKWASDELSLQIELATGRARVPHGSFRRRIRSELTDARQLFEERGWLADPISYHREPQPLTNVRAAPARLGWLDYQHVRFDSMFEPWDDEPGRERWLGYQPIKTGHGWMLRHEGRARPWIVLVNGYRTGDPRVDLSFFRAGRLHHHHGLNVMAVVLPLHGPRRVGTNGSRVLHAGAMNTIFTLAHGASDVRAVIRWLRDHYDAEGVGISGISLGGYLVGLVAGLEPGLAGVIGGVPESDLVRNMRRQLDPLMPPYYEQWGLSWEPLEQVFRVVSPLAMPCLVPRERRYIYAGLLDRWVRPGNVRTLWNHWDQPDMCWYEGSHLSFPAEPDVHRYVDRAITEMFELDTVDR